MTEPVLVPDAVRTEGEPAGWPWPTLARSLGVVLLVGGMAAVVGAYLGVRGAASLRDELAFVATGGIGGLAAVGLGAALLVVADLARSQRRIHALGGPVVSLAEPDPAAGPRVTQASDVTSRQMATTPTFSRTAS